MKYLKGVLFLWMSISCGRKKIPSDVLPIDQMKLVVWDMMKMDEYYIRITLRDTLHQLNQEQFKLYSKVFGAYNITKQQFYSSYDYYQSNPVAFKTLIDSIDAVASRQKTVGYNKKYSNSK